MTSSLTSLSLLTCTEFKVECMAWRSLHMHQKNEQNNISYNKLYSTPGQDDSACNNSRNVNRLGGHEHVLINAGAGRAGGLSSSFIPFPQYFSFQLPPTPNCRLASLKTSTSRVQLLSFRAITSSVSRSPPPTSLTMKPAIKSSFT